MNIDSPDHKSHMSYVADNGYCPATHPVPTPGITFNIVYQVTEDNSVLRWRLSSDMYDASIPAGYSGHGDWFNGWQAEIMDTFVHFCDVGDKWYAPLAAGPKDCHSHLLGDGRYIE